MSVFINNEIILDAEPVEIANPAAAMGGRV